jgi:hypothetical protein
MNFEEGDRFALSGQCCGYWSCAEAGRLCHCGGLSIGCARALVSAGGGWWHDAVVGLVGKAPWVVEAAHLGEQERIYEGVVAWREKHLKLEVNREKSGVGTSGGNSLLWFRIFDDGRVGVSPKAIGKLKDRVRQMWDARQSLASEELRDQWQRYICGWWNHFQLADRRWEVTDLGWWIRRQMRKCFWLRWKTPRGRINQMGRLGVKGRPILGCLACG